MENFIAHVRTLKALEHLGDDARPAVLILIDLLFLARVTRNLTVRVKRMSKLRDIFDIGFVLGYIRRADRCRISGCVWSIEE
jgi:hypothetical protein